MVLHPNYTDNEATGTQKGGCQKYGCGAYHPQHDCQCNRYCMEHGTCCGDYVETCGNQSAQVYKSESEAWSFEPEPASKPKMLTGGVYYDPQLIPQLASQGCEDTYGWANGHTKSASTQQLMEQLENATEAPDGGIDGTLFSPKGFTCEAYAVGGWCNKPGAIGAFSNYPERNCCICGGGTTVSQLMADVCPQPTAECTAAVNWAMQTGIHKYRKRYPGLNKQSSFVDFQAFFASSNQNGCTTPCKPKENVACHTSQAGEECYDHVKWAMETGMKGHSEWYPGMTGTSTFEEFQKVLYTTNPEGSKCKVPCEHSKGNVNQVVMSDSVDTDLVAGCPRRPYTGQKSGSGFCFAQLAKASGTQGSACSCRQGCKNVLASRNFTVSFKNIKGFDKGKACSGDVLLTVPRQHYRDYGDLLRTCGRERMVDTIEVLMRDAWDTYHEKVCKSAMWHCFHSPQLATVPFLHMQSFSADGWFHGMPTSDRIIGTCVKQAKREETRELALKMVKMF